jgi:hypothetical protein
MPYGAHMMSIDQPHLPLQTKGVGAKQQCSQGREELRGVCIYISWLYGPNRSLLHKAIVTVQQEWRWRRVMEGAGAVGVGVGCIDECFGEDPCALSGNLSLSQVIHSEC